ncbi:MAG: hypothetical protein ACK41O_15815 [Runella zeae]
MTKAAFQLSNPELEGEIYYLTEQEGGRRNPIASGYRGQFYYNGRDWDAPQTLIDKELCYPGETVKVRLQMLSPNFHVGQFYVGQSRDNSYQAQALVDEICNRWREEIQLENSHYKIELLFSDKGFYFELTFATWHTRFLTGKIIVNTTS